jgi:hypothetical protein
MSKDWMKIGSDSTINGGFLGCTVVRNRVSHKGGFNRIWLFVLKHLNSGNKTSPG